MSRAICLLIPLLLATACAQTETRLTVLSFNAWGGGMNEGKSTAQTIAVLRAVGADLIGLQETKAEAVPCTTEDCPPSGPSVTPGLARALGYHYHEQSADNIALWSNAVLSRYPIVGHTPLDLGVQIDLHGRTVYLFNIHPTDYPYPPYQLLGIPYGDAPFITTSAEAVAFANLARQESLHLLERELASAEGADLVVVTGDFNEPSHRDWTERAVTAGLQPLAVPWPFTSALEAAGFVDVYRNAHPDEVLYPGFTWSPLIKDDATDDHRDRIDFVFVKGTDVKILQAKVAGESETTADIVVTPWPSDHRAVLAEISF